MQKYKDALELQALQEDKAQDQLKIDNEHLLGKIQVRGFTLVSMPEKPISDDWCIKRMGIEVQCKLVRFLTHVNLEVRAWQCQEGARNDFIYLFIYLFSHSESLTQHEQKVLIKL